MSKSVIKAAYLLVVVLVLHGAALPIWWQWDLWCAKQEAWTETNNKTTVRLVLSKADFNAQRVGRREFWHNGGLYDIRRSELLADSICLWAYRDQQEAYLYQQGERLFAALSGVRAPSDSPIQLLVRLLFSVFLLPNWFDLLFRIPTEGGAVRLFVVQANLMNGFRRNLDPPPEQVFFRGRTLRLLF